jgi:hypothetical protein
VTAYSNVAAGAPIYASTINDIITASLNRPTVLLALPANQSVTDAATSEILFGGGSEIFDTHNWHSTSSNTGRVTPTIPCVVLVTLQVLWAASTQDKRIYTAKNGTILGPVGRSTVVDSGSALYRTSREIEVNGSTDYVSGFAFQDDSGGTARNVTGAGDTTFSTFMSVTFLRYAT